MISKPDKNKTRQRRHARVRGKISGTSERPRLNVFRSNKNIALIAKRAVADGHKVVVFDRGGYLYHGRVAALAEAARENGLEF